MAPRKTVNITVKKARKKPVKKRAYKRGYKKQYNRRRVNSKRTSFYSGTEEIFLRTFSSLDNVGFIERFDLSQFPRLVALAPEFKHVKINKAVVKFVPRQAKQAWYNVASTEPNLGEYQAQGKSIISYIKKDGSTSSDAVTLLQDARLEANAKFHSMQTTSYRSFIPYCIQKKTLVKDDTGATADLVQMTNPWLDTVDPNTYKVDRTSLGVFSPQLVKASDLSEPLDYRWDMYVKIFFSFKGVNHVTADE